MANKLIIVLSGKKMSGKTTMCNYIRARYLNMRWERDKNLERNTLQSEGWMMGERFHFVNPEGGLMIKDENGTFTEGENYTLHPVHSKQVKVYSFADPLKDFCINVLGVPYDNCWGTDEQKNAPLAHLLWDNLPEAIRPYKDVYTEERYVEFSGTTVGGSRHREYRTGPMTAREVMQVFGTDICRKLYGDCWAFGTYNKMKSDQVELALVADARFPNEIKLGAEAGAKTVRLARNISNDRHASEIALDDYPKESYTLYVDNTHFTLEEQCRHFDYYIDKWFSEAGI